MKGGRDLNACIATSGGRHDNLTFVGPRVVPYLHRRRRALPSGNSTALLLLLLLQDIILNADGTSSVKGRKSWDYTGTGIGELDKTAQHSSTVHIQ